MSKETAAKDQAAKPARSARRSPAPSATSQTPSSVESQHALADPLSASSTQIAQLQRGYGNRAVQRLIQRTQAAEVQREAPVGLEGGEVGGDLQSQINSARSGGQPLDKGAGSQIGGALGADFSNIKVHTDSNADNLNRSLSAKAFTLGNDVFFSQGAYNPGTHSGKQLLAHELTHVVQQGSAGKLNKVQTKLTVGPAGDKYEEEADQVASQVMRSPAKPSASPRARLQRKPLSISATAQPKVQRLLTPLAKRAFDTTEKVNPAYTGYRAAVDKYIEAPRDVNGTMTAGKNEDAVTENEQMQIMNLGDLGTWAKIKQFVSRKTISPDNLGEKFKDLIRAKLLYEFATRIHRLQTDDTYQAGPAHSRMDKLKAKLTSSPAPEVTKGDRRQFYLKKALEQRDKDKALLKLGVNAPETKAYLSQHGFTAQFAGVGEEQLGEALTDRRPTPRIDVRATYIAGPILGIRFRSHLFIVYTGRDGRQMYFRGGPGNGNPAPTVADMGDYAANTVDYDPSAPSVTVLTGDAAENKLDALMEATSIINGMDVPYTGKDGENCNATAWTILNRAGVPTRKPTGIHTGWGKPLGARTKGKENAVPAAEATASLGPHRISYSFYHDPEEANTPIPVYGDRLKMTKKGEVKIGDTVDVIMPRLPGTLLAKIRFKEGYGFIEDTGLDLTPVRPKVEDAPPPQVDAPSEPRRVSEPEPPPMLGMKRYRAKEDIHAAQTPPDHDRRIMTGEKFIVNAANTTYDDWREVRTSDQVLFVIDVDITTYAEEIT